MFPAFEKYRIVTLSALILLALTLAAGISVYVVMQRQAESLLSKNLAVSLQSNVRLFESRIDYALSDTQTAATRPSIIKNLQLLASKPGSTTGRDELRQVAISLLPIGITGLSIYDVRGHEVVRAGHLSQKHDLRVPLKSNIHAVLLWEGQFILQASMDVLDQQGRRIGSIMTEASLPPLTRALADVASIGKTGDLAVCAPLADDEKNMACFPSRISVKVFKLFARVVEGKPLPMNHALNGETGIIFARDYRREQVVAAYAPVGAFGLGMVIKIDRGELYQPVTEQLKFIAPLLAALVMAGILLLNFLVNPLVKKLVDSERATRDANALLRSSEARFANIVNLAADAIISVDEDQRILIFNYGAELIFGYTVAEMLGQPLDRLLPERYAGAHRGHIRQFGTEPQTARHVSNRSDIFGLRRDGSEFSAEANISWAMENEKQIFTVFLRDISERKQAEEALRESEQRLRIIIETEPECVKVVSPQGNLLAMNAAGLAMLEAESLDEAQHSSLMDFILPEYQDAFRALHSSVMQGESGTLEFEVLGLKGTRRRLETHAAPMRDAANKIVSLLGITRDITERIRIEEEIRQLNINLERRVLERTTELAAANQELEAFSYSVSHDLRAPLRAIDGFSQAVLEDYADKLDDQGKDYLNRVRTATQRMGHLIDDMLTLSRVTRAEMRRETVDLSALAADVFAELQKSEPLRPVDWHIESGLVAEGDAQLLRVVLVNLLGNAWKFTGKTANAKIELGVQNNAESAPGFFVRDNGAGYDMAYADKLFGAFQRLHLASDFTGTGIGLATVQRIVHRHGGRLWAEGFVGKGATFYFTL